MNAPANLAELLADLAAIREDIAFARALRRLKIITPSGEIPLQFSPDGQNVAVDLRSLSGSGQPSASQIPAQTGQAGKLLATDGSVPFWFPR